MPPVQSSIQHRVAKARSASAARALVQRTLGEAKYRKEPRPLSGSGWQASLWYGTPFGHLALVEPTNGTRFLLVHSTDEGIPTEAQITAKVKGSRRNPRRRNPVAKMPDLGDLPLPADIDLGKLPSAHVPNAAAFSVVVHAVALAGKGAVVTSTVRAAIKRVSPSLVVKVHLGKQGPVLKIGNLATWELLTFMGLGLQFESGWSGPGYYEIGKEPMSAEAVVFWLAALARGAAVNDVISSDMLPVAVQLSHELPQQMIGSKSTTSTTSGAPSVGYLTVKVTPDGGSFYVEGDTYAAKDVVKAAGLFWSGSSHPAYMDKVHAGFIPAGVPAAVWYWSPLKKGSGSMQTALTALLDTFDENGFTYSLISAPSTPVPGLDVEWSPEDTHPPGKGPAAPKGSMSSAEKITTKAKLAAWAEVPGTVIKSSASSSYYYADPVGYWRKLAASGDLHPAIDDELMWAYAMRKGAGIVWIDVVMPGTGEAPVTEEQRAALYAEVSSIGSVPAPVPTPGVAAFKVKKVEVGPGPAPIPAFTQGDPNPPPAITKYGLGVDPVWAKVGGATALGQRLSGQPVGKQRGSMPGGRRKDPVTGEVFYVKWSTTTAKQVRVEVMALQVYRAMGIYAPDARLAMVDGKVALISPWKKGYYSPHTTFGGPGGQWSHDQKVWLATCIYPVSAWLANHDVIGVGPGTPYDNVLVDPTKTPPYHMLVVDAGGAGPYKGTGGDKPFPKNQITELAGLLDPDLNPTAAESFVMAKSDPTLWAAWVHSWPEEMDTEPLAKWLKGGTAFKFHDALQSRWKILKDAAAAVMSAGKSKKPIDPAPPASTTDNALYAPYWYAGPYAKPPHALWTTHSAAKAYTLFIEKGAKPGGSSPGAVGTVGITGPKVLVKHLKTKEHAYEEEMAAALMRACGLTVPDVRQVGTSSIMSPWVEGPLKSIKGVFLSTNQRVQLIQSFYVNAWLANWDVVGASYDNLLIDTSTGNLVHIDVGGALRFRAQGAVKPLPDTVTETQTLLDPSVNPTAAAVYAQLDIPMLPSDIRKQVFLAMAVASASLTVTAAHPDAPPPLKALNKTLRARLFDMANQVGFDLAETLTGHPHGSSEWNAVAQWWAAGGSEKKAMALAGLFGLDVAKQIKELLPGAPVEGPLDPAPSASTPPAASAPKSKETPWAPSESSPSASASSGWTKILTEADLITVPNNGVIAAYHAGKYAGAWLRDSDGLNKIESTGAVSDIVALTAASSMLALEEPVQLFLIRTPTEGKTPQYATLKAVTSDAAKKKPPEPDGTDVAAGSAGRAQAFLKYALTWAPMPLGLLPLAWTLALPGFVIVPGWGSYYITPHKGNNGYLLQHGKNDSQSLRLVKADGSHINIKAEALPAAGYSIDSGLIFPNRDAAAKAAAKHVEVNASAFLSTSSPMGKINPPPLALWIDGAWQTVQVAQQLAPEVEVIPESKVPTGPKELAHVAAGAFITDGKRVLLLKRHGVSKNQPGTWSLPAGGVHAHEKPEDAAKREAKEELGALPSSMVYSGLTIKTTYAKAVDSSGITTFYTVVFVVKESDAAAFKVKPMDAYSWESDGWAWVPLEEIHEDAKGATRWSPKVHFGLGHPLPVEEEGQPSGTASVLALWKSQGSEWVEYAKTAAKGSVFTQEAVKLLSQGVTSGIPFQGQITAKAPAIANPAPFEKGVVRVRRNGVMVPYRSRRRGAPRVQVYMNLRSAPAQQAETHRSIKARYGGVAEAVLHRRNGRSVHQAWLLDQAGLPLHKALPMRYRVKNPDGEVEVEGKIEITKGQANLIDAVYDALVSLLGTTPMPSKGTAAQQALKAQIQTAIGQVKSSANNYDKNARFLRYLVLARHAGLWGEVIDPGSRVVYRTMKITPGANEDASGSFGWSPEGKAQAALVQAQNKPFWAAADAWIASQSGIYAGAAPGTGYDPGNVVAITGAESDWGRIPYNFVQKKPAWSGEPWANVEGFRFHWHSTWFAGAGYGGKHFTPGNIDTAQMVGHWKSIVGGYGGWGSVVLRANTSHPGFVLLPEATLAGSSYEGEREIMLVSYGDEPLPAEVIGTPRQQLSKDQVRAYCMARPPYPQGEWEKPPKKNPGPVALPAGVRAVGFGRRWSEADAVAWLAASGHTPYRVSHTRKGIYVVVDPRPSRGRARRQKVSADVVVYL